MRRFFLALLSLVVVGALAGVGTSLAARPGTGNVIAKPSSIALHHVKAGDYTKSKTIRFTNLTTQTLTYYFYSYSGEITANVTDNTCEGAPLAPNASCTLQLQVSPSQAGPLNSQYVQFNWTYSQGSAATDIFVTGTVLPAS